MLLNVRPVIAAIIVAALAGSCSQKQTETTQQTADSVALGVEDPKYARILYTESSFDFGKIKQGDTVRHTFNFKNDGDVPLLISGATASCGCTIPNYPKEPIAPGAEGKIEVQFNSMGKSGVQNKTITITANTLPNTSNLVLKGEVEAPAANTAKH